MQLSRLLVGVPSWELFHFAAPRGQACVDVD